MKPSVRLFWRVFAGGIIAFLLLILLANFGLFGKMPSLQELENPSILQASEVYAQDGTLMGKYYTERGNRSNVKYRDLSRYAIDALIATEDERFYSHSGIDFKSTLRALATLGSEGGGSTITQQLAKALLAQGSKNKAWRVIIKSPVKKPLRVTALELELKFEFFVFDEFIVSVRPNNFLARYLTDAYLNLKAMSSGKHPGRLQSDIFSSRKRVSIFLTKN